MSKSPSANGKGILRAWVIPIIAAILIATSFKSAIADWNDVPSGSMLPTIWVGDRIFINKLAYGLKVPYTTLHLLRWSFPKRGEIAVFYSPENGQRLVKRIIGVPGDTIAIKKNRLFINGKGIEYQALGYFNEDTGQPPFETPLVQFEEQLPQQQHPILIAPRRPILPSFGPIQVPAGHYFMMGDNRDNSHDSRFFGLVPTDKIVGKALAVVISRNGNLLHPRWRRMFKALI